MHALERIHRTLVPGGLLLDMHPVPPPARAEAGGEDLGAFDEGEFFATVRATERGLEEAVRRGLEFDERKRFDTAEDLLEAVESWDGFAAPPNLAKRIQAARPPVFIRQRVVLRRLRALPL